MADAQRRSGAPFLLVGFALFVAAIAYLVASSLVKRTVPTFDLTPSAAGRPRSGSRTVDTVTVDAADPKAWRFFDLARGSLLTPPDTSGWDLAMRRYTIIAADAIADLGPAAFDAVARAPERGYVANAVGRDTANPAIRRWYDYRMLTHLLEPKGHIYVVRTRDGQYAKLEVLSYYCTGMRPGCVTFRYAYPTAGPQGSE